jgi:hypothetical protein
MRGAVKAQTSDCGPKGCLGVIGATACGAEAESIRAEVIKRRESSSAAIIERFRRAREDGDLQPHVEPEALAQFLYTILQGLAVQAGAGATREELERVVDTSLAVFPSR